MAKESENKPTLPPGIYDAGGGKYRIQVYTGLLKDGKRERHTETVRGLTNAKKRRMELLTNIDKGAFSPTRRLTVADHLKLWLDGYVKTNTSLRTQDAIESIINNHLVPNLGHFQLKQLTPHAIEAYYRKALENLSSRSVHYHHRLLKQSFKYAVRKGYLGSNPCDLVDPPKPSKKQMRTLTPGELEVLLEVASDNQFYPVIYTAVSSGLRQAELLGLRWRDVDPDITVSMSVNQVLYKRRGVTEFKEPKTAHSRRRVSMTPKLACYLRQYRSDRVAAYKQLGGKLTDDCLVFGSIDGRPCDPSVLTHNFARIVKKAGLESVRFHDLRHTFASLMLSRGAPPKVISEALGHSSVAFTMDTYSHIIKGMQEEAMSLLNEVMPEGVLNQINTKLTQTVDERLQNHQF
jgi:integrase